MWLKALRIIPRLEKEEWDKLDIVSRWLIATRGAVLIMTFISAAIAGILAATAGMFHLGRWVLLVIGLVFAHATNNMVNDYTDFKHGVDKDNYFRTQYGPQPLESGFLTQKQLFVYIAVTGAIALAAGIPLVIFGKTLAFILLAAGAFFVLFYTWPLKFIGLGELAVIIVWGPLMIGGGYYVITGQWDWNVVIASLPYALGTTLVIFGKHIDKRDADKAKGIHTLPVLIGEKPARILTLTLWALQYLAIFYLVIIGYFHWVVLVVLIGLFDTGPKVLPMYLSPKPKQRPENYPENIWPLYYVAGAFLQNRSFGMLFLLGLLVNMLIKIL